MKARRRRLELWIGFEAWLFVNGALMLVAVNSGNSALPIEGFLLFANVFGLPLTTLVSRRAALGGLLAFAAALAMTVVEGVVYANSEFSEPSTTFNYQFGGAWLVLLAAGAVMTWLAQRLRDEGEGGSA